MLLGFATEHKCAINLYGSKRVVFEYISVL